MVSSGISLSLITTYSCNTCDIHIYIRRVDLENQKSSVALRAICSYVLRLKLSRWTQKKGGAGRRHQECPAHLWLQGRPCPEEGEWCTVHGPCGSKKRKLSAEAQLCLDLVQGRKGKRPPLRGPGLPSCSLHPALASETKMSQVMLLNSLWRTGTVSDFR